MQVLKYKFLKKDSQPATVKIDKPILIIQGTQDMSVPYPVTEAMYKAMLAQGTNVGVHLLLMQVILKRLLKKMLI